MLTDQTQLTNPLVQARVESGISVTTLAKQLGVSKQYVSRAEHGTYTSLNNQLVKFGAAKLHIHPGEFVRRYKEFQHATRQATANGVAPQMLSRRGSNAHGHEIFANWRGDYWHSVIAFCNAFCVHPEVVRAYEDGIRMEMPTAIREALNEVKLLDPNWSDRAQAPKSPAVDSRTGAVGRIVRVPIVGAEMDKGPVKFSTNFPDTRNR